MIIFITCSKLISVTLFIRHIKRYFLRIQGKYSDIISLSFVKEGLKIRRFYSILNFVKEYVIFLFIKSTATLKSIKAKMTVNI